MRLYRGSVLPYSSTHCNLGTLLLHQKMKAIRRVWFKIFPTYKRLELKFCKYSEADALMRLNEKNPEEQQWRLAKEEDKNFQPGMVYIERRVRILI